MTELINALNVTAMLLGWIIMVVMAWMLLCIIAGVAWEVFMDWRRSRRLRSKP